MTVLVQVHKLTEKHSSLIHSLGNLKIIKENSMSDVSQKIWLNSYKIVENFGSNERLKISAFEGYLWRSSTTTFPLPLSNLQEWLTGNNTNLLERQRIWDGAEALCHKSRNVKFGFAYWSLVGSKFRSNPVIVNQIEPKSAQRFWLVYQRVSLTSWNRLKKSQTNGLRFVTSRDFPLLTSVWGMRPHLVLSYLFLQDWGKKSPSYCH